MRSSMSAEAGLLFNKGPHLDIQGNFNSYLQERMRMIESQHSETVFETHPPCDTKEYSTIQRCQ
jgi:hypothetical protein